MLGQSDDMGKLIGLDKEWSYRIIKQVGNYGESWTEFSVRRHRSTCPAV